MITLTYLPLFVTVLFRGMPGIWKSRHRLMLCWLVVLQALFPGRKTLEELTRWTPAYVTVWSTVWRLRCSAQGRLLGCPSAGRVVGRGSAAELATAHRRDAEPVAILF
jgi:hypothetical protein